MTEQQPSMVVWSVAPNPIEGKRAGGWNSLRDKFVAAHPLCECCGRGTEIEVHHCVPVSVDSNKELEESNLISLCNRCHLVVGHLNSWHRHNPKVREDSRLLRGRHQAKGEDRQEVV